MMHTNKMILVPHEIVGESESSRQFLSSLDREMMRIMQDSSLANDEKMIKYQQVLQRYQNAVHERDRPFQLEIKEQAPSIETLGDEILQTVPQKWRKQAGLLLQYVRRNPNIKWSEKGEMIINGNKIIGSNIIDLIIDFSRSRKGAPVAGAEIFLKKLFEDNIPKEAILNKARLHLIDGPPEMYATPEIELTAESPPKRTGRRWKSMRL